MYPFALAAGVMALYLGATAVDRPRPAPILASVLWAAYAVYEWYVANGTLCDKDCNIRVDLVLFLPLLGSTAYVALQKEPRTGAVTVLYVVCLGVAAMLAKAFGYPILAAIAGVGALVAAVVGVSAMLAEKRV
jgi:CDP-diglyceride synthetase